MAERTEEQKKMIEETLDAAEAMTGWSRQECANFISCITAKTPDALLRSIPDAMEAAVKAETTAAGVDLMKRMGRIIEARMEGGEFAWRFHPDCKIVTDKTGNRMDIDFAPLGYPKERA